jgi:Cysteine-rich secretory protein family
VALAAALLAACGGHPPLTPAELCVDYVNQLRATKGLAPLARWTANEACADAQAASDSQTNVAHGAFGSCPNMAQNECPGWPALTGSSGIVPGCLDMMWAEGPTGGHYQNMTRAGYTMVSCGYHVTADGRVWAVQDFR